MNGIAIFSMIGLIVLIGLAVLCFMKRSKGKSAGVKKGTQTALLIVGIVSCCLAAFFALALAGSLMPKQMTEAQAQKTLSAYLDSHPQNQALTSGISELTNEMYAAESSYDLTAADSVKKKINALCDPILNSNNKPKDADLAAADDKFREAANKWEQYASYSYEAVKLAKSGNYTEATSMLHNSSSTMSDATQADTDATAALTAYMNKYKGK